MNVRLKLICPQFMISRLVEKLLTHIMPAESTKDLLRVGQQKGKKAKLSNRNVL